MNGVRLKPSWKALILAPLPIPLIVAALLTVATPGQRPVYGFLFFFVLGSALSYGITIFLFLPGLFAISRFRGLTPGRVGLLGTTSGLVAYLPIVYQSYSASGVDSGPPELTFGEYLRLNGLGWDFWALLVGGLVTAMLYWFLAGRRGER